MTHFEPIYVPCAGNPAHFSFSAATPRGPAGVANLSARVIATTL